MSSVGNRAVYEADGQHTAPDSEKKAERFKEGKRHPHQPNDSSAHTSAEVYDPANRNRNAACSQHSESRSMHSRLFRQGQEFGEDVTDTILL
jgi:hypothetical protein